MTPQQRLAADLLPYNHTHVNHPCAIWVRSGLDNYVWGLALAAALVDEFRFRFGRRHATADVVAWLSRNVPTRVPPGSTTPPQAMPEGHRGDDVVAAYRRYYFTGSASGGSPRSGRDGAFLRLWLTARRRSDNLDDEMTRR